MLSGTKTKTALNLALTLSLTLTLTLPSMLIVLTGSQTAQAASNSSQPFLKAIDPSTAQFDAPPPPQAEQGANGGSASGTQLNSNPFGSNIQGRPLGQTASPLVETASADDEARITRLEKQAFGSTYIEHEAPDRLDHLEKETFGAVKGGALPERIGRLEQKLFGGSAFNAGHAGSNVPVSLPQSQPGQFQPPQTNSPQPMMGGQTTAPPSLGQSGWQQSGPMSLGPGQGQIPAPPLGQSGWQQSGQMSSSPGQGQTPAQPLGQSGWQQSGQMSSGPGQGQIPAQPLGQSGWQQSGPMSSGPGQGQIPAQPLGQSGWQQSGQMGSGPGQFSSGPGQMSSGRGQMPPQANSFNPGWTPSAYMPPGSGRFNPLSSGSAVSSPGNNLSGADLHQSGPGHNSTAPTQSHGGPAHTAATHHAANSAAGSSQSGAAAAAARTRPVALTADSTLVANSLIYDDRVGDYLSAIRRFPGGGGFGYARWKEFPVRIKLPENSPESWQRNLEAQVARWNSYIPLKMTLPAETADIETIWVNQLPPKVLGVTRLNIVGGQLKVWIYMLRPSFYPPTIPERTLSSIFAREVGHALGLFGQSDRPGDMMSSTSSSGSVGGSGKKEIKLAPVGARDINTLKRLYEAPAVPSSLSLDMPMEWATTY